MKVSERHITAGSVVCKRRWNASTMPHGSDGWLANSVSFSVDSFGCWYCGRWCCSIFFVSFLFLWVFATCTKCQNPNSFDIFGSLKGKKKTSEKERRSCRASNDCIFNCIEITPFVVGIWLSFCCHYEMKLGRSTDSRCLLQIRQWQYLIESPEIE